MTIRASKALLLFALGFYYTLVVFNNTTDFDSNYQFVRHVLSMDTTFPGNAGMYRAIRTPIVHKAFYASIIGWEARSRSRSSHRGSRRTSDGCAVVAKAPVDVWSPSDSEEVLIVRSPR